MSVTASFQPDRIDAVPGETVTLALHLQNTTDAERMVTLRAGGDLATQTVLQTETIYLDPNEHFEVPVIVDANSSLAAGTHSCVIEVVDGSDTSSAAATVEITASAAWTSRLEPKRSRSSAAGRHKVAIENSGNVPITVELATQAGADLATELAAPAVNVDPGKTAKVEFRASPHARFWNGAEVEHPFSIAVSGSDGETIDLDGVLEQGPRLRPWFAPALAGMLGAVVVGTAAWFAVLKPSVEDSAQATAVELDTVQEARLDERVVEIQAAADEASQLPLGQPTDQRLTATAAPGVSSTQAFDFDASGSGRVLSISDVIFQNPTGAVGRVELLRDGDVLLDQEMANFRDLDFHLVAPFRVESGSSIALRVTCTTPGPTATDCEVSATIVGFVDQT